MFHTLSELYEKEKNKGKQKQKKSILNMSKERSPHDNYYGKGNKAYDHYNKRPSESLNEKFEKTKNKIKLIVFKNGFILNNGPFRDRSIPENNQFMEEVERGNIPHELLNKGINDLGILLINRKKEIYYQPIIPNNNLIQITQTNQVNPININPIDSINNNNNSYNAYNQFINFDFNQFNNNQYSPKNSFNKPNNNNNLFNNNYFNFNNNNIYNNYTYNNINNNTYKYNTPFQKKQRKTHRVNQFGHYEFKDPLFVNIDTLENTEINIPPQTPMGDRNKRKDIFIKKFPNTERRDYRKFERYSSNFPITNLQNNFESVNTFQNYEFIQGEKEEYNQEQMLDNNNVNNINDINNINNFNNEKIEEVNEENKDTDFNSFGEIGQNFDKINTEEIKVKRNLQNDIDILRPSCLIYIILFNGEMVKARFNYSQTLLDIYLYVKRISGYENFSLLHGSSSEPLVNYELTIGDLKLENEIITQSINL